VHFVGAGCGAVDLITLRGQRLIAQADLIVYAGSLVNPALLESAKPDCRVLDSSTMTLPEVVAALAEAAGGGQETVRLHSGDPSLYGAIREQMDALDRGGVPYDICPGVSSMAGTAAALRVEYTVPEATQSVVITRMAGRTPMPAGEDIAAWAQHGASMVVFLSTGWLTELAAELVRGGYAPDGPAALVYKASWPDERVIRCTVAGLPEAAAAAGITKTALVVVGPCLAPAEAVSRLYAADFATGVRAARP
jgi:precorrin-4/cobalt-precorrin-4 C11-methyltransferase